MAIENIPFPRKAKINFPRIIAKRLLVGVVLLFMVLVIHHPILKSIKNSRLPFNSEPDTYYIISVIQWNIYAMSKDLPALYHLNYFYPHAYVSFYGHPLFGQSFVFLLLNKVFGLNFTRSYDFYLLLAFWIGALGTFLLTKELTRHSWAPYFASFLFILYPYIRQLFVHLNIFSFFWVGFVFYYLIRFQKKGQWKNALLAGFFIFIQGLFCIYHGFFLIALLLPLFSLFSILTRSISLKNLLKLILVVFLFGLLLVAIFHPFLSAIKHAGLHRNFHYASLIDTNMLFSSASLFYESIKAFGIPAFFPGFSVIFLFVIALTGLNKKGYFLIGLLLFCIVVVFVLTLKGFYLVSNWIFFSILAGCIAIYVYRFKELSVELKILFAGLFLFLLLFFNYAALVPGIRFSLYGLIAALIPSISDFRFLYRGIIIFIPVFFALAAYGISIILEIKSGKKYLVLVFLCLFIILENGYVRTLGTQIQFQPFKYREIAKNSDKILLELPIYTDAEILNNLYTINSLCHNNYYVNGRVAFRPFDDNYWIAAKVAQPGFPDSETLQWLLDNYSVDYIIFNWKSEVSTKREQVEKRIRELKDYCQILDKNPKFLLVRLKENFPLQTLKRRYSLFHIRHRKLMLAFSRTYKGKISILVTNPEGKNPGQVVTTEIELNHRKQVIIPFPQRVTGLDGVPIELIFENPVKLQELKLIK